MKVSHNWLQTFFEENLPKAEDLEQVLTFGAFEIEGVEDVDGDSVIDVDVLPNRAHDCLGHRGIAKEIATLTGIEMAHDPLKAEPELIPESNVLSVEINDATCVRYTGAVIKNVSVKESPEWLKNRLEALGQKSINNIVDATNYVMFGLGQPTHVFDFDKLENKDGGIVIEVRSAKNGEEFVALGGEQYELDESVTVIADRHSGKNLGVAGVKGGVEAELDEDTTNIVLESAKFLPGKTRKTAQKLKIRTDASARFENEPADELCAYGMRELADLIVKVAGGEIEGFVDTGLLKRLGYKLGVSLGEVNRLLGTKLSQGDVENVFKKLKFEYEVVENPIEKVLEIAPKLVGAKYKADSAFRLDAPEVFSCSSFTNYLFVQAGVAFPSISVDQYVWGDIVKESDLQAGDLVFSNSETGKIHRQTVQFMPGTKVLEGVDHVGLYIGGGKMIHATRKHDGVVVEELVKSESFKNVTGYRRMVKPDETRLVVSVPFERLDLRIKEDLIEEIGRVYGYKNISDIPLPELKEPPKAQPLRVLIEAIRDVLTENNFTEVYLYSLRNSGDIALKNALASDKDYLRSNLADGVHEALEKNEKNLPLLGLDSVRIFEIGSVFTKESEDVRLCVGVHVQGKKKKEARTEVELQKIKEIIEQRLGIKFDIKLNGEVFEINLNDLVKKIDTTNGYPKVGNIKSGTMYKHISPYPFIVRDIAMWTPEGTQAQEIEDMLREQAGRLLARIDLFDQFEKDGKVSFGFRLVFQSDKKTLTDEEITPIMEKIEKMVGKKGFEVR